MGEFERINYLLNKMRREELSIEEYRDLQYFLIKNHGVYKKNYPITETSIHDDKLLFIADTHIGSEYENRDFIDGAYNYAVKNGIKTAIHLGDFVEGKCRQVYWNRGKDELRNEIERAISYLPNEVKTKLLFGNHDLSVFNFKSYPELLDLFFLSSKLDILGLGRIILNWNNIPIGLKHEVSHKLAHIDDKFMKEAVMVCGHSHIYECDETDRIIKVPSLSNELKDSDYHANQRLFQNFNWSFSDSTVPFLNFIAAGFVDEGIILFENYAKNHLGDIVSCEKVEVNGKTKELKKYKN